MTGFKKSMKRLSVLLLAVLVSASMIPFAGDYVFAADRAVVKAAKEAGVDVSDKKQLKAFSDALEEADIDVYAADDQDGDQGVPAITTEDGAAAGDKVPIARETGNTADVAEKKAKGGKSIKNATDFPELSEFENALDGSFAAGQTKHCEFTDESGKRYFAYRFTAQKSGTYFFYADGSNLDTCGAVMDSDGEMQSDDDSGEEYQQFKVSFDATAGKVYYLIVKPYDSEDNGSFDLHLVIDEYTASINVTNNKATGKATVTGTVQGDKFYDIYVDGSSCNAGISGKTSFSVTIDMKNYDVGYHEISAQLYDRDVYVYYKYAVPTYIYSAPSLKKSDFTTWSKYFVYTNNSDYYNNDYDCGVYVDYKKKGGKWQNNYGPVSKYSTGKRTGLKANKYYYVRAHYGKKVSYNGKSYFFTGKALGKVSKAVKIKTGKKKKPKIKSIKITKAKQFSRTFTYTTWIYIGGYGYPRTTVYRQWYTSFKVTVKLKKKTGAKGIYIGSKRLKGNKKTYSTNFTVYGKYKGKKIKVGVCSYQNNTYKGYSPSVTKKVKVK